MLLLFQSKDGSQTVSHPNIFFRTKKYKMNGICINDSQVNSKFYKNSKGLDRHAWVSGHQKMFTLAEIQQTGKYGIQTIILNGIPQK